VGSNPAAPTNKIKQFQSDKLEHPEAVSESCGLGTRPGTRISAWNDPLWCDKIFVLGAPSRLRRHPQNGARIKCLRAQLPS
jgi:hypothetical protein